MVAKLAENRFNAQYNVCTLSFRVTWLLRGSDLNNISHELERAQKHNDDLNSGLVLTVEAVNYGMIHMVIYLKYPHTLSD